MSAAILDGRAKFGQSLVDFWRRPELVVQLARRGVLVPPLDQVDRAALPALAYVNPLPDGSARWIADCPACVGAGRTSAQYVWLAAPLLLCVRCANGSIGGKWRPIRLPSERSQIERLLLARPDPATRVWGPGTSLDAVVAENVRLLGGGG